MKNHALFAAIFAALAGFSLSASGAEQEKPASESTTTTTRAVPFPNYWDAKAWDRSGGVFFWHKQTEDRPPTKSRKPNPRAAKSVRATTPLTNR